MPEFTAKTLSEKMKVDQKRVSDLLVYYNLKDKKYFKRLAIKEGKFYRYTVTQAGVKYLAEIERMR